MVRRPRLAKKNKTQTPSSVHKTLRLKSDEGVRL